MARKIGDFLQGTLGSYVFKIVNGKQFVYPRPIAGTMKQTSATKMAASVFGYAALMARYVRKSLFNQINRFADNAMINRFVALFLQSLTNSRHPDTGEYSFKENSFLPVEGFEFNLNSKLSQLMLNRPYSNFADGSLTVTIPTNKIESELKFPDSSFQCEVRVNVSLLRLGDRLMAKDAKSQMTMVTRDQLSLEQQEFKFNVPAGCLCMVSTFLQYANYSKDRILVINNKQLNPGQINSAFITPGIYQGNDQLVWEKMTKNLVKKK